MKKAFSLALGILAASALCANAEAINVLKTRHDAVADAKTATTVDSAGSRVILDLNAPRSAK